MSLVFLPKRVVPRVSPAVVGDFNKLAQLVPKYLPDPSPVISENNKLNKTEIIRSELKSISQDHRVPPQEFDSNGPQPPSKKNT
ncbi:hypothetical protein O181_090065 [Austropuccinia psidii MF-1]|uniref:Uncharacterized protein n=1 Tax=Austropuccinia psidii MF-1 TaxID=1389203 RepID=A0A9Q3IUE5_9BASI|nr:hypothetical protein [Austropuccinia psidii MF-1]